MQVPQRLNGMTRNVRPLAYLALLNAHLAVAQTSPFATGASALQTNLLTILAPVAIIAVMVLGVAAWFNRISWSWMVGGVAGIVMVFGASQVVAWIRGLFGV